MHFAHEHVLNFGQISAQIWELGLMKLGTLCVVHQIE